MTFHLKINHRQHSDNFENLLQYETAGTISIIGCDCAEGQVIGRSILGSLSAFLNTAIADIAISELDRIIIPDFGSDIISLAVHFLYNGTVLCTDEQYYDIIEVLQLLGISHAEEFKLTDVFGNDMLLEENNEPVTDDFGSPTIEPYVDNDSELIEFDEIVRDAADSFMNYAASSSDDIGEFSDVVNNSTVRTKMTSRNGGSVKKRNSSNFVRKKEGAVDAGIIIHKPQAGAFRFSSSVRPYRRRTVEPCRAFSCTLCPFTSDRQVNVRLHHKRAHSDQFVVSCDLCDSKFTSRHNLRKHSIVVHRPKKFRCDFCSRLFSQACRLRSHILSAHSREGAFPCGDCGVSFVHQSQLATHSCSIGFEN